MLFLAFLLAVPAAWAEDGRAERTLFDALEAAARQDEQPLFRPNQDWRARGLAYIDLPLRIRARFDASYTRHRSESDTLAAPMVAGVGPGLRIERQIESRIALTRPLTDGIELELVWETRNRIESGDPMSFGRQIVGAMIRITP